jgi:transposase InsO family protein
MRDQDKQWALFWCSLLHPVLFGEVGPGEERAFLEKLAEEERLFPNGVRKRPSLSTLRRKLRTYRESGFDALLRKPRSDRGASRTHERAIIEKAIELKREQPRRSEETINKFLEARYGKTLPKSTLYRYLRQAGATRLKLGLSHKPVRRRWTRDHSNALWVGDFEHGPYVLHQDRVVESHLCGFIDCHSRFVVAGRYYYRETLDILIDALLRAWAIHGASEQIYVDQAKVFLARGLKTVCYRLKIDLLHRKRGDPSPGGLIEKLFQTTQSQFEAEVRAGDILTLEQLNRAHSAWLEMSYHRRPHGETGEPPAERYQKGLKLIRPVDMQKALECFMQRAQRTVHHEFSDVQLGGRFFRVDKRLRGDRVDVRYDPYGDQHSVLIYSLHDKYLAKGVLHQRERGEDADPQNDRRPKPKHDYLALLISQHEDELRARSQGIDYRRAMQQSGWPFAAFAKTLAELLGRKGGLSSFSAQDLEVLQKLFNRNPRLDESLLRAAVERAHPKTLVHVLYQLQDLINRKERQNVHRALQDDPTPVSRKNSPRPDPPG